MIRKYGSRASSAGSILGYSLSFDNLVEKLMPGQRKSYHLRIIPLMLCCVLAASARGQSGLRIDTANYYSYIREGGTIEWLRLADAVPVIIDEIRAAGFAPERIEVGKVLRLDKTTVLVITVAWQGNKPFGFMYESGHSLPLRKEDRDFLEEGFRESYVQAEYSPTGEVKYQKVGRLPKNVFLLRERCYWYQQDSQGGNYPVDRDLALRILRQDIRAYLIRMIASGH